MDIKIKLPRKNAVSLTEPFICKEDQQLTILFETEYKLNTTKITLRNGEVSGVFDFCNNFIVPEQFMFDGKLYITVEMFMFGRLTKRWEILPINIERVEGNLLFIDYLTALENRIASIEKNYAKNSTLEFIREKINDIAKKQNEIADTVNAIKENC